MRLRLRTAGLLLVAGMVSACASTPSDGPLGEGAAPSLTITAVDTALPPHHADIRLDQQASVALILVAPGHSATVLYPRDSTTSNRLGAGEHRLAFQIPETMVLSDSMFRARIGMRGDTTRIGAARRTSRGTMMTPIPPTTPTYLLAVSSPQPLHYGRLLEKTLGVSIPIVDIEALNAVGKAIKSTIPNEPRVWAGYYRLIDLRRQP